MGIELKTGSKNRGEKLNVSVGESDRTKVCYVMGISVFLMYKDGDGVGPR